MMFKAPWSRSLKWISGLATVVLLGTSGLILSGVLGAVGLLPAALPVAVLIGGLLFTIRGYEVHRDGLRVHRLIWVTDVSLENLHAVWSDPEANSRSFRLFGNGGLYSFSGLFRNQKLGTYRAFVTNPASSVVLDCGRRKIVITPDRPAELIRRLQEMWPEIESATT